MKTRIIVMLAPALFALASLPLQAATTEDLILAVGTNTITVDQSGVVTDSAVCTGCTTTSSSGSGGDITFQGTIDGFSFDLDSGQADGGVSLPELMNTTTINTKSAGAGTLTVTFSQTGYTGLASTLTESASDTYTANTPNTSKATFSGYTDSAGTLNAKGTLIGTVLSSTDTSFPASQSDAATKNYANANGSGSLTEVITLAFAGAGTIDTGFTISNVAVPEPASVVFLGSILLGLTALVRKRQSKRS